MSSIDDWFVSQITPYQLHHDSVLFNQFVLSLQSSPDVDLYISSNTLATENKEGADDNEGADDKEGLMDGNKVGMTDIEGAEDEDSEGFKVANTVDSESAKRIVITTATTTIDIEMIRAI